MVIIAFIFDKANFLSFHVCHIFLVKIFATLFPNKLNAPVNNEAISNPITTGIAAIVGKIANPAVPIPVEAFTRQLSAALTVFNAL